MTPAALRSAALLAALAAGLAGPGCDPFDPRADDARTFAVFGALDGRRAQQRLRVQDLSIPLTQTPDRLPASVVSVEVRSGVRTAWRDSLVTLTDGTRGHLFLADLAVRQGEVHRIEAVRPADGGRSVVTVALPDPVARADAGAATGLPAVATPVRVTRLLGLVDDPTVRYRVERPDGTGAQDLVFTVPGVQAPETVVSLSFGFVASHGRVQLYGEGPGDVVLTDLRFEGVARSDQPDGVESGVGTVGWTVPLSVPIDVPGSLLTVAGFVDGR